MSEPSETNEAAITDEPKWANGDVTLISSDNVRFKVSSELLAWGSPVFADMLSLPGDQERKVVLSDPFENAKAINVFLTLISEMDMPFNFYSIGPAWSMFAFKLTSLVRFLDKYSSERGLRLLRFCALHYVTHPPRHQVWCVADEFILGAILNYPWLCADAFRRPHFSWIVDTLGGGVPSKDEFSTRTSPMEYLSLLPVEYHYALLLTERDGGDFKSRGKTFLAHIEDTLKRGRDKPIVPVVAIARSTFGSVAR